LSQAAQVLTVDLELFGKTPQPVRDAHFVEARQPARPHPSVSFAIPPLSLPRRSLVRCTESPKTLDAPCRGAL
jgi:hypothetical protein